MPYNSKSFGIVISRLRMKKGLSQETFSAFAGIARSHLTTLENGGKTVRLDTFCRIAEALEMKPSELMKLTEEEERKNKTTEDQK
ncbi:MAG: helix-turn-helix transcriptional regulator [Eubacteriales bacterium]|nr:helix-turn-helix transcriptional regulator [Eubacteriales bacterium]